MMKNLMIKDIVKEIESGKSLTYKRISYPEMKSIGILEPYTEPFNKVKERFDRDLIVAIENEYLFGLNNKEDYSEGLNKEKVEAILDVAWRENSSGTDLLEATERAQVWANRLSDHVNYVAENGELDFNCIRGR